MTAIDLLKARQTELAAQAAAKVAKDALWKREQARQLEPVKIAMREIATAEPPVVVMVSHSPLDFRENNRAAKEYDHPLNIDDCSITLRVGYDRRFTCTYEMGSTDHGGCHFLVKDHYQYGRKAQAFTDPIAAIDCLVGLIAEHTAKPKA